MKKILRHQCCGGALRIMKILSVQIFLAILLTSIIYAHNLNGQGIMDKEISVEFEGTSLKKVLSKIERVAGVKFTYSPSVIAENQKVSIRASNQKLAALLDELLSPIDISYKLIADRISLYKASDTGSSSENQTANTENLILTVKGTVVDENSQPLPGVNVIEKGTTNGTTTDADGRFSLNVQNENSVLVFSFIGYTPQEVPVNGRTMIDVALAEDVHSLEEVVVIGYGSQKKVTLTGAISSVNSEDLVKSPAASVANTLAGRVTGLATVQSSGMPGSDDPRIYVRGIGSLTESNSSPLILVDGVERSFSQLDPNEIETITVLKDASATAVFGIRGANGVVIVTTKRGSIGAPKISFSSTAGIQAPTRLLDYADAYTYATMYNRAQLNDNPDAVLKFSPEAIEAFRTHSDPLIYPDMDWVKEILKPASFQMSENVNISGGTNSVRYFVSLGYLKQDGMFRTFGSDYDYNFGYKRYNYRANIDIDVTKTTKVSLTTGGRSEVRNQPYQSNNPGWSIDALFEYMNWATPYTGAGIVDGKWIKSGARYISGAKYDALDHFYGLGTNNKLRNILNLDIAVDQKLDFIAKGLLFKVKVANNSNYTHVKDRGTSVAFYEPYYEKDIDPTKPDSKTIVLKKFGTDGLLGYSESFAKARDWYLEGSLFYNRSLGDHNLTGLLLYNQSKVFYPAVNVDIPHSYVGFVGRATYDYKNKYLLDLNMGYNGSENFAPDQRFGLFPAASLGWVLSEENFMKAISFIEFLKVRGSYGIVGNDRQGNSRFLYLPDSYNANTGGYNFGTNNPSNQMTAAEGRVGNPIVSWETSRKRNIGFDISMFDERLAISADVFDEYRDKILTTRQTVPGFIAMNVPALNIGIVKNRGYEFEVKWSDNKGDFGYFIKSNMSFARNKVIFKDEIPRKYDYLLQTGNPVNQPFGYAFDGFWSTEDVTHLEDFPDHLIIPKPGDMRYKDLNSDDVINTDDMKAIGYPDYPEYVFGTTLEINYKNFDVSMLLTGVTHASRSLGGLYRIAFGATYDHALMQYMVDGQWTPETASTATFPRLSFSSAGNNYKNSDFWLKDASYVRLKNAEIGYRLNIDALKRLGISNLRAYINGYNLLTFDKIKVIDPEVPGADIDYPMMKIYNVGISATF